MRIFGNLYGPDSQENKATFEELIVQNEQKIHNVIYGMTGDFHLAQDLTQEAFIKAFRAKESFKGQAKFSTWLYRIAVNVTVDHQRKSCVNKETPNEQIDSCSGSTNFEDPDNQCQKKAVKDILFKNISRLPEQLKEVFILREINGCSTKETSEILSCTQELVKWRLHKARTHLRKNLQEDEKYKNIGSLKLNSKGIE